jgi:hypothetical protein
LNYQNLANDIIGGTQAVFNSTIGNSFFNFGPTFPSINNRIYPWLDETGRWWIYDQGVWLYENPVAANGYDRRIFVGTTTDLLSYDGGDGTATATTTTGPMWEVDTEFEARFPVGVGAFVASGAVAVMGKATSTAIVGEDKHTLTVSELAAHTHNVGRYVNDSRSGGDLKFMDLTAGTGAVGISSSTGGDAAHNNLPPFYGVYFIKRTTRIYYVK